MKHQARITQRTARFAPMRAEDELYYLIECIDGFKGLHIVGGFVGYDLCFPVLPCDKELGSNP